MTALSRWIVCILAVVAAAPAARAATTVPEANRRQAVTWIVENINDPETLPIVLAGLKSTNDKRLLPVFTRLSRHDDREVRLMATAMVAELAGKDAAPVLLERLESDPAMVIRGEALIHLARLDAISDTELLKAAEMPDPGVQVIAARALGRRGQAAKARDLLARLAESRDMDTQIFARMTLLDLGDDGQIPHLREVILDEETPPDLLVRMLNQMRDEKITKALPVARYLAKPSQLLPVRIRAYWAIAELADKPGDELATAIRDSDSMVLRLNILRMLAERDDAGGHLRQLAGGDDSIAATARFELARQTGAEALGPAVVEMVEQGHPVVIEYLLNRFRQDIDADRKDRAEQYVQPLLGYLGELELTRDRLTGAHDRGATIVELLADHGSHAAVNGLKGLLKGTQNSPMRQLVSGALYRSDNAIAADLVAPLLDSAYSELYTYAALVTARHGGKAAIPVLIKIQDNQRLSRPDVLVLANWYLIDLSGLAAPSIDTIIKGIE